MDDLEKIRNEINLVDDRILEALANRRKLSQQVIRAKDQIGKTEERESHVGEDERGRKLRLRQIRHQIGLLLGGPELRRREDSHARVDLEGHGDLVLER